MLFGDILFGNALFQQRPYFISFSRDTAGVTFSSQKRFYVGHFMPYTESDRVS